MEQFGEEREIGKTRKKEKQSLASKNGYESMSRRPWIKILEEFYATQFLQKTGKTTSLMAFMKWLLLSNDI